MLLPLYILFTKLRQDSPQSHKAIRANLQQQSQILSLLITLLHELPSSERWIREDETRLMSEEDAISSFLLLQARLALFDTDLNATSPEEIIQSLVEMKSYWLALQVANQVKIPKAQIASLFVAKFETSDSDLMNASYELLRGDPTGCALCGFIEAFLDKDSERALPTCVYESFRELLEKGKSVTTPVMNLLLRYGRIEDCSQMVNISYTIDVQLYTSLETALKQNQNRVFISLHLVYQLLSILDTVTKNEAVSSVCQESMRCRSGHVMMM